MAGRSLYQRTQGLTEDDDEAHVLGMRRKTGEIQI